MKRSILFLLFIFIIGQAFSQSLAGDWKGKYETNKSNGINLPWDYDEGEATAISLRIIFDKDSSYSVYSFTRPRSTLYKDTTVVCKLTASFVNDSVYLREVGVILPTDYPQDGFQTMYLKIIRKKKFTALQGTWKSKSNWGDSEGTVYFKKENE